MSEQLALAKLASSGLGHIPMPLLHMEVLSPSQTAAVEGHFAAVPSICINYMDPRSPHVDGQPLRHHPLYPPFRRYRYLVDPPPDRKGKVQRYVQPTKQGVCAYFPPLLDWNSILLDTDKRIFITEGELKACKATSMGFPTIGLGGVNNICSRKTQCEFLPELDKIDWATRDVFIVFDNDGQPKPDVLLAVAKLVEELQQRGGVCYLITLPAHPTGGKMGLDDYFLVYNAQDFTQLIATAQAMGYCKELWKLNDTHVVIQDPLCVVETSSNKMIKLADFKAFRDNQRVPEQAIQKDGSISLKPVPVASHWTSWPMRMSAPGIAYIPGQPAFGADGKYNMWRSSGLEPKKGDISLFMQLLDHMFGKGDEGKAARKWFLQWAAYPLQNPGAKLYTSVLLWSPEHGVGKTLMGYQLRNIYGLHNCTEINQAHLTGSFNSWAERKQFVIGDDITGSDKRELADRLKSLITQDQIRVNEKYIPEYTLPNRCNFLLTSNRASALYLEDDDRRSFVWKVANKPDTDFFKAYDNWYQYPDHTPKPIATAAVHHYLLGIDCSDFNPKAKALTTEAKTAMIEDARSAHSAWIHRMLECPELCLRIGQVEIDCDLFSAQELLNFFMADPSGMGSSVKAQAFGCELKAAGVRQIDQLRWGNPTRRDRFFAVRNAEKWLRASSSTVRKYVESKKK